MRATISKSAVLALALGASRFVTAQTFSDCNPVEGDDCDPNPAFGGKASIDLTSTSSISELESFFIVDDGVAFSEDDQLLFDGSTGMEMRIATEDHNPLLISNDYLFFGHVEVELQAAPGAGIVTSIVLQSDSLDEIDFEFIGNDQSHVQTNYFYKGIEDFTNGEIHEVAFNPMETFHTYAVDWTPEGVTFTIDGNVVSEVSAANADLPQTPCQLRLGTWVGGKGENQGTIDWAGGLADFSKGPFQGYYRNVKIVDFAGGYEDAQAYEYSSDEGTWESITVIGGTAVGFPDSDLPASDNHEEAAPKEDDKDDKDDKDNKDEKDDDEEEKDDDEEEKDDDEDDEKEEDDKDEDDYESTPDESSPVDVPSASEPVDVPSETSHFPGNGTDIVPSASEDCATAVETPVFPPNGTDTQPDGPSGTDGEHPDTTEAIPDVEDGAGDDVEGGVPGDAGEDGPQGSEEGEGEGDDENVEVSAATSTQQQGAFVAALALFTAAMMM